MILDKKAISEIKNRFKEYLDDGLIKTRQKPVSVKFFLDNAEDSLISARCLYDISLKKDYPGYENLNGYLWVVNASYYSMFYTVRGLLEDSGIKIQTDYSIHMMVFDALVNFFYITGRLNKKLLDYYLNAKNDSVELLGKDRAKALIEDYSYEKRKRSSFTYEIGISVLKSKAETSIKRAARFNTELRKVIK